MSKYKKGAQYKDTLSAIEDILLGKMMYYRNRVQNPTWMSSLPIRQISHAVKAGHLYEAIKINTIPQKDRLRNIDYISGMASGLSARGVEIDWINSKGDYTQFVIYAMAPHSYYQYCGNIKDWEDG